MTEVQEQLRQAMAQSLDRAPSHTAVDAGRAWDAGRTRRRRRRAGAAVAVAGVVGAVTFGSVVAAQHDAPRSIAPADGERPVGITSYPERVDGPRWWTRDVEGVGEPLAGVLLDENYDRFGVTAAGQLWRIPLVADGFGSDVVPVLSDDGSRLAWLRGASTYQMLDVVTGKVVVYDGIGENRTDSTESYTVDAQTPGFFSPDGTQLVVQGWRTHRWVSTSLLLDDKGGYAALPRPHVGADSVDQGAGETEVFAPIGWADEEHLYWRAERSAGAGRSLPVIVTASLDGQVTAAVPVPGYRGRGGFGQWMASVAPGGERIVLRAERSDLVVDPATGGVLERLTGDPADACSPSWRGDQVLEPTYDGNGGALRTLRDGSTGTETVAVSERGSCLVLTPQALAGRPTGTVASRLFGTSTSWLSWHLDELVAGVVGLAVLLAALVWWRRRRSARRA